MVIGAFPIAKLGALVIKQVSKPLAKFLQERAKKSPFFRNYICMPPAQFYNWCEVKAKMWAMNLGKPVNVPSLNEAMAIELGSNLLGESVIFLIASGIVLMEYNRGVRKEYAKEQAQREEIEALNLTIQELYFQMERQDTQIRELSRKQSDIETGLIHFHWPKKSSGDDNNNNSSSENNGDGNSRTANDKNTSIISRAIKHSQDVLIYR